MPTAGRVSSDEEILERAAGLPHPPLERDRLKEGVRSVRLLR